MRITQKSRPSNSYCLMVVSCQKNIRLNKNNPEVIEKYCSMETGWDHPSEPFTKVIANHHAVLKKEKRTKQAIECKAVSYSQF